MNYFIYHISLFCDIRSDNILKHLIEQQRNCDDFYLSSSPLAAGTPARYTPPLLGMGRISGYLEFP